MKKISEMTPGEALTEQALAVFKRRLEQARKKAVESAAANPPAATNPITQAGNFAISGFAKTMMSAST